MGAWQNFQSWCSCWKKVEMAPAKLPKPLKTDIAKYASIVEELNEAITSIEGFKMQQMQLLELPSDQSNSEAIKDLDLIIAGIEKGILGMRAEKETLQVNLVAALIRAKAKFFGSSPKYMLLKDAKEVYLIYCVLKWTGDSNIAFSLGSRAACNQPQKLIGSFRVAVVFAQKELYLMKRSANNYSCEIVGEECYKDYGYVNVTHNFKTINEAVDKVEYLEWELKNVQEELKQAKMVQEELQKELKLAKEALAEAGEERDQARQEKDKGSSMS